MFVSSIVIDHQMGVEVRRDIRLDELEEAQELLVPVAGTALGENLTIRDVEGGEQGRGAMSDVIVCDAFEIPKTERQHGLGTFQCLDL